MEQKLRDEMTGSHNAKRRAGNAARNITVPDTGLEMIEFKTLTAAEKRVKKREERKVGFFGESLEKATGPKYCTYTDVFDELVEKEKVRLEYASK